METTSNRPRLTIDFGKFAANPPLLHTWDGGKTWNTGGFHHQDFELLRVFFDRRLAGRRHIIETGCGNSTIFFLLMNPDHVVTIDPDERIYQRVIDYCDNNGVPTDRHEMHLSPSEMVLPKIAALHEGRFNFALIDGNHGWPTVFVDFCYCNVLLGKGGFLMLDDAHLHSVKELVRFLADESKFGLALDLGKAVVFEKLTDDIIARDWGEQRYIARLTEEYQTWRDPNRLYPE